MKVLTVNAGSSSLKYQLFDMANSILLAKGNCERIGLDGSIEHRIGENGEKIKRSFNMPNHSVAIKAVVEILTDPVIGCLSDMNEIEAVGHRVVHGGPYFFESCIVTDEIIEKLKLCIDFAPLHTPAHLMGIEGCRDVMPSVPQVLVFDTAFHQTMPEVAYIYPISYEYIEKYKIRRYGAHGTSHRYVSQKMAEILGRDISKTKIITCHIGNGSSISAVDGGKCVDTSMGLTPLEGVEMGTRCGSIDPAIVTLIMRNEGYNPDEMDDYMNKKCGFLGLSGISPDSREIETAIIDGNHRAWLAANVLAYQIKKYIGSYTAAMNGLDAIVFTAGMGENNSELRERVCTNMEYLGIELDYDINKDAHHQSEIIKLSKDNSKVAVYLIPTNEELVIASDTQALVHKK